MASGEYTEYEIPEYLERDAAELALHMPTIAVSDVLMSRLARHDRSLQINELALFDGIKDAEVERPIVAQIDSLSRNSREIQPKIIDYTREGFNEPSVFTMAINARPDMVSAEGLRRVNATFWKGVLVAERLAEDATIIPSQSEADIIKRNSWIAWSGALLAFATVSNAVESVEHFPHYPGLIIAGVYGFFGPKTRRKYVQHRLENPSTPAKLEKKLAKQAEELGESYSVLMYGVTQ